MAQHLNSSDIDALPIENYSDFRSKLVSGDLLFASGEYFFSKVTQRVTHSPWSHVGIIFRFDDLDRVLLLESVEDSGVRFAPLSKYLHDYHNGQPYLGRIVVARSNYVTPAIAKQLAEFGMDQLTHPYDLVEMAKILGRVFLGIGRKERNREYICSELVYECFRYANKTIAYNPQGFISPEDVWVDDSLSLIGRLL